MNSIKATANYLKSSELVAKTQIFFGIRLLEYNNVEKRDHQKSEHLIRRNNCNVKKEETGDQNGTDSNKKKFIVTNKFWYYLFIIGTELGDEIFYATFIPFLFWNVDSAVGRRMVFIWATVMYVGQALKDVIKDNRPGPPSQQLQQKWANEYGNPSTHAMSALCIPLSVVIYTMDKYDINIYIGLIVTIMWLSIISLSRVYLGMHTMLDLVTGILLTIMMMIPLIPAVDYVDYFLITNPIAPVYFVLIPIVLLYFYPIANRWTPTRSDTTTIVATFVGCYLGVWLNAQLGYMNLESEPRKNIPVEWPTWTELGLIVLRTVVGLFVVAVMEFVIKFISFWLLACILRRDRKELKKSENSLENKPKIIADLFSRFCAYMSVGLLVQFIVPIILMKIGIMRQSFYDEI